MQVQAPLGRVPGEKYSWAWKYSAFLKLQERSLLPLTLTLSPSVCCFIGALFKIVSFRKYTLGRKRPPLILFQITNL